MRNRHLIVGLVLGTAACTRQSPPPGRVVVASADAQCIAIADSLPLDLDLRSLAGEFSLRLVGGSGPAAGRQVAGVLDLSPASRDTLMGRATVLLDSVGAIAPGPRPRDNQYRVLGLKWQAGVSNRPQVTIRFGSFSEPAGTQVIEGAHMALSVASIRSDEMRGTWSSGTGDPLIPGAAGHFCASRLR